jgi:hypothetical protein
VPLRTASNASCARSISNTPPISGSSDTAPEETRRMNSAKLRRSVHRT